MVLHPGLAKVPDPDLFMAIQSMAIIGISRYGLEHLATPFKGELLNSVFRTKPNQSSGPRLESGPGLLSLALLLQRDDSWEQIRGLRRGLARQATRQPPAFRADNSLHQPDHP